MVVTAGTSQATVLTSQREVTFRRRSVSVSVLLRRPPLPHPSPLSSLCIFHLPAVTLSNDSIFFRKKKKHKNPPSPFIPSWEERKIKFLLSSAVMSHIRGRRRRERLFDGALALARRCRLTLTSLFFLFVSSVESQQSVSPRLIGLN